MLSRVQMGIHPAVCIPSRTLHSLQLEILRVLAEVGKAAPGVSSGAPAGVVAAAAGPLVLHRLCSIGTQATSHQV